MNIALIDYSSPRDLNKMTFVRTVDSLNSTVRAKTGIFPYFPCVVEFPRQWYKIQGYYIQVGLKMTSRLAGLVFAIQKGSVKYNLICLC